MLVLRFGGNLKCNFGKMYFYSRINFINDFFSILYCYIVYFLLVLDRKSKFTFICIYFALGLYVVLCFLILSGSTGCAIHLIHTSILIINITIHTVFRATYFNNEHIKHDINQ